MPFPVGAAIMAGGQLLGGLTSNIGRRKAEDRQHKRSIEFWNMQNKYNSPQEQMKRLQEAGLNPNLVYGQGSGGASGQAAPVPEVKPQIPENVVPQALDIIGRQLDYELKQATIDNVKRQGTVILEDALLKQAQRKGLDASTETSVYDLGLKQGLEATNIEYRKEELRKIKAEADMSLSENERRAIMNERNVTESIERVLTMRLQRAKTSQDISNLKQALRNARQDETLKKLDVELQEMGISRNSPFWFQWVARWIIENGGDINTSATDMFLGKKGTGRWKKKFQWK